MLRRSYTTGQLLTQWSDGSCTPQRFAEVANASAVRCANANVSQAEDVLRRACKGKHRSPPLSLSDAL